ncbi:MAG: Na+/H+ antiporter NhaA [Gammaproteobacteria bacterium]|nr:MAG: Na+/H+ antiporter NhaA [Gammaproteobacteria bacterium]
MESENSSTKASYIAPWESAFDKVSTPFEEFIHNQTSSGIVLMVATIIALVLANSIYAESYHHFIDTKLSIGFDDFVLEKSLHHWINDGLMALFFFLVGLEIKSEILVGELSSVRNAILPIVAAIGGMAIPAGLYVMLVPNGDGALGWAIPMATDIAFAVGVLVLLGKRAPASLMMFLVALAIVDDLGAVIIIALFYTDTISVSALIVVGVSFAILIAFNLFGVRSPLPYFLIGVILWFAMLKSGVHATLAGVLVALTIPAMPKYNASVFIDHMSSLLAKFRSAHRDGISIMRNFKQRSVLQAMENGIHKVETPLQRLEHSFHIPVGFFIIPIFALVNAGIPIDFASLDQIITHPITLAIIVSLIGGKFLGIFGAVFIVVKLGWAKLPTGVALRHIAGASLLAGIGFTMAIFIAELAFVGQAEALLMAKTGVLIASLLAGIAGSVWLLMCKPVELSDLMVDNNNEES